MCALEYSIFPDVRRLLYLGLMGIHTRIGAWTWVDEQIKENLDDRTWMLANSLESIPDVAARVFSQMGNCRFPLHITPTVVRYWCDISSLVSTRRMQHHGWPFSSPRMDLDDLHPTLPIFRAVVERNLGRARRRYLRACGSGMDKDEVALEDGSVLTEPSDDDSLPMESADLPLELPPPFSEIQGSIDPRFSVRLDSSMPSFPTRQRRGEPSETAPDKSRSAINLIS